MKARRRPTTIIASVTLLGAVLLLLSIAGDQRATAWDWTTHTLLAVNLAIVATFVLGGFQGSSRSRAKSVWIAFATVCGFAAVCIIVSRWFAHA